MNLSRKEIATELLGATIANLPMRNDFNSDAVGSSLESYAVAYDAFAVIDNELYYRWQRADHEARRSAAENALTACRTAVSQAMAAGILAASGDYDAATLEWAAAQ